MQYMHRARQFRHAAMGMAERAVGDYSSGRRTRIVALWGDEIRGGLQHGELRWVAADSARRWITSAFCSTGSSELLAIGVCPCASRGRG
jgi:hypothetical protein